jgi:uncharacterized membrane protein YhaH (DUF805 family)
MSFVEAISSGFRNYVGFSGRAPRSEYWFWVLFVVLVQIVTQVIDYGVLSAGTSGFSPLTTIAGLGLFLPGLAMGIRRLHDLDKSGWWTLIVFIPLVGIIILLVWACTHGTMGPNRFGPDPLGG